jgi:hypothetical protein
MGTPSTFIPSCRILISSGNESRIEAVSVIRSIVLAEGDAGQSILHLEIFIESPRPSDVAVVDGKLY